jgi:uncharacterized repeat protein (TIGR02543 family)
MLENMKFTAKWTAKTDIPYVVNHYLQNIENDEYTLDKTDKLQGTADSLVNPSVNTYIGFTPPTQQEVTISADGSLVVNYYYTRNSYTITLITNGGTGDTVSKKYQDSLVDINTWTTRDGYSFVGWFMDEQFTDYYSEGTMPNQSITLYACWAEETLPRNFLYEVTTEGTISIYDYVGTATIVTIPQYIGDQLKGSHVPLGGGDIPPAVGEIQPCHRQSVLIDRIVVEGESLCYCCHPQHGVMLRQVRAMPHGQRKASRCPHYLLGIAVFQIQRPPETAVDV